MDPSLYANACSFSQPRIPRDREIGRQARVEALLVEKLEKLLQEHLFRARESGNVLDSVRMTSAATEVFIISTTKLILKKRTSFENMKHSTHFHFCELYERY